MKNNKAQALVIFVIFLPVIILFISYIFDTIRINYEENKINNIALIISNKDKDKVCEIVLKNDKDIICNKIDDEVILNKRIKSIFGKIIGKDFYDIKVSISI